MLEKNGPRTLIQIISDAQLKEKSILESEELSFLPETLPPGASAGYSSQDWGALALKSASDFAPHTAAPAYTVFGKENRRGKRAAKTQYRHRLESKPLLKAEHAAPGAWRAVGLQLPAQLATPVLQDSSRAPPPATNTEGRSSHPRSGVLSTIPAGD